MTYRTTLITLITLILLLLIGLGISPSWAVRDPVWTPAGSFGHARTGHTATLLPSGKVLIAGGRDDRGTLASAELYDPATGTWTRTGPLAAARDGHAAILLPCGKVLVVGGKNRSTLASAELYDPATGAWTATTPLAHAREGHSATLLRSKQVLVAGGTELLPGTAELYDPATGSWTAAGVLDHAGEDHTATHLPSGEVLVVGATGAELYDPASASRTATTPLAGGRTAHSATLLRSGKVLVAGGTGAGRPRSDAELYDPATRAWTATGPLADRRASHTATLLTSGKVLVVGGRGDGDSITSSAELYDPATGAWTRIGPLAHGRTGHTATLLPSGSLLIAGGETRGKILSALLSSTERYDPAAGAWTTTGPRVEARSFHVATLLPSGQVLVVGGTAQESLQSALLASAELYDPATDSWTITGSPGGARALHTVTLLPSGKALLVGGVERIEWTGTILTIAMDPLSGAELYDPAAGIWTPTGSLAEARSYHTATLLPSGKVLVTGGWDERVRSLASAELYDPVTGAWTVTGSLNRARAGHSATLLPSGEVLVAGGLVKGETDLSNFDSAELYDPTSGTWTATGSLGQARAGHSATLLPSGEVLVAGGLDRSSAELYDPATGHWRATGSLRGVREGHAAQLLPSGKVLVAGGHKFQWNDHLESVPLLSLELYDPITGAWTPPEPLANVRAHSATLLPSGAVLVAGGADRSNAALYAPDGHAGRWRPRITAGPETLRYGQPTTLTVSPFRGNSEANVPLLQTLSIEGAQLAWLVPDPLEHFRDEPIAVTISDLPPTLNPGWHHLAVVHAGMRSESKLVRVECGIAITAHPEDQTVAAGSTATFSVRTQGGRRFQWQKDGVDVAGATGADYTTPPITAGDSGTTYRVKVENGCTSATSRAATLTAEDREPPVVTVISPSGGEYWQLPASGSPADPQQVVWSMSDNVRICRVEVSLWYSDDGGMHYSRVPDGGGLPAAFGRRGSCPHPGEVTQSTAYIVPATPPSGSAGSLYQVRVRVEDHAGRVTTARSRNPFYIVQPHPDGVKTLILANTARMRSQMGIAPARAARLQKKLQELASHPQVQGRVIDLHGVTTISNLYAAWDADSADPARANAVLFGPGGIHEHLLDLVEHTFTGVKYVVLVGDDRIIPLARIQDRTILLLEENYPAGGDLTPDGTTVGQALAANKYLSDDPLAVFDPVHPEELSGNLYIPDLALGRLVETPEEIITTIATFISQDGVVDLTTLDPVTGHKVLVTGYDFLLDSGKRIRTRWKNAFGQTDDSLAPVDGRLLSTNWGEGSVTARRAALRAHLSGHGGDRYAISILTGHATHYQEGVPGTDAFDIHGLDVKELYDAVPAVNLAGSVVFALGCHGGLPVAGSIAGGDDQSLDLPQTMAALGVLSYVANTGYGWGLKHGIGYGERLFEILTEEMTRGGTIFTGDAVKRTKQRYFLETPRFDPYDEKSLMQWSFFGLPMVAVKTGIRPGSFTGPPPQVGTWTASEWLGPIAVTRQISAGKSGDAPTHHRARPRVSPPKYLTRLDLHFDLTADGVYTKRNALGDELAETSGCPKPPPGEPEGCYYTLNMLMERGTGETDLPIQPYFVYDSRLSGTSQHGVLWKGGVYEQETGWVPVIAELMSNGGNGSERGATPQTSTGHPTSPRHVVGRDPEQCRPSDREINSLVVVAEEVLKDKDLSYSIERHYREIELEVFYFNNTRDALENCDRTGPVLAPGPHDGDYHLVRDQEIIWTVPVSDEAGVWRVVVVVNDGSVDESNRGSWEPLELTERDGNGTWHGSLPLSGVSQLTYVIQAVDRRGNVTWLEYENVGIPSSGVPFDLPLTVRVDLPAGKA